MGGNNAEVTCQLTIFNVTDEDEGEYECYIMTIHDTKRTRKNITIYGKFIINVERICIHLQNNYTLY